LKDKNQYTGPGNLDFNPPPQPPQPPPRAPSPVAEVPISLPLPPVLPDTPVSPSDLLSEHDGMLIAILSHMFQSLTWTSLETILSFHLLSLFSASSLNSNVVYLLPSIERLERYDLLDDFLQLYR
jgi:hypothetical protein